MRALTRGNIKAARKALRRNRARSLLTMLGIIIGVAAVISVASIGEGVKRQVAGQINKSQANVITVRAGVTTTGSSNPFQLLSGLHVTGSLSAKDTAAIRQVAKDAQVAPLAIVPGRVDGEHAPYTNGPIVATNQNLPQVFGLSLAYGVFFQDDNVAQNTAIVGSRAAEKMFDSQVPLGHSFKFRGQAFMVSGILNQYDGAALAGDIDYNDAIFIPYSVGQQLTQNSLLPYEVAVKTINHDQVDTTAKAIDGALLKNHGDSADFSVTKASDTIANTSGVLTLLTELVVGAAAISLLVGGIGIMNITLLSVSERMREIGIRKAVGATNRQILQEFIVEAVVLSVSGAIIGIVVAGGVVGLLRLLTDLKPVIQWQVVLIAAGVSMIIGIVFGTAPALKAARKDPISALRGE